MVMSYIQEMMQKGLSEIGIFSKLNKKLQFSDFSGLVDIWQTTEQITLCQPQRTEVCQVSNW